MTGWQERAHERHGVVPSTDLGGDAARSARRAGLVLVQPRVWVAGSQPVAALEQVAAISESIAGEHAFTDLTALWLYELRPAPAVVRVGTPHSTRYRVRPPARAVRLRGRGLQGARVVGGHRVVALEVAVVQSAALLPFDETLGLVEQVLRDRRTTLSRLRARCGRGVAGSRAVRAALDRLVGASLDGAVRDLAAALERRGVSGLRTEVRFENAAGASAYGDLVDDEGATVVEVDGFLSHTERRRFLADRRRDRWVHREHGLTTFRVDVEEVLRDLEALADELADLLLTRRRASAA